jgi:hypothetical protein
MDLVSWGKRAYQHQVRSLHAERPSSIYPALLGNMNRGAFVRPVRERTEGPSATLYTLRRRFNTQPRKAAGATECETK